MSAIVLLSGGCDSAIAYYHTLADHLAHPTEGPVHVIAFDYGQRHARELSAAAIIHSLTALSTSIYRSVTGEFLRINLSGLPRIGSLIGDSPLQQYKNVRAAEKAGLDTAFIPHRNALFITQAAMWARQLDADHIVTGLRGGFPDCTEEFERALEKVLAISDPAWPNHPGGFRVTSPVHISRADSITMAATIPECLPALAYALTCFEGDWRPCMHCLPCLKRAEGFELAGIKDPLLVRLGMAPNGDRAASPTEGR